MNIDILPQVAFGFLLIFARVGTLAMVLPSLGERGISTRARLVFALVLTFVLMPLLASSVIPDMPGSLAGMLMLMLREIFIGLGIGLVVRLLMGVTQTAATTIAFQMGLGFAQNVDPTQGIQGAILSSFMSVLALTLIMATDTHHLLIAAIYDSYTLFPHGVVVPAGDFATMALNSVATAFRVAIQIAAPFIIFGTIFYLGLGILSRLIPQIQIFFVAMPLNILFGFVLFVLLLTAMMSWFIEFFHEGLSPFLLSGG